MARNALAAVSIALLTLAAATAAHAQHTSATVVIGADAPRYHGPAPVVVQYQAPHHPAMKPFPTRAGAWSGCPATGSGVATAMSGNTATG